MKQMMACCNPQEQLNQTEAFRKRYEGIMVETKKEIQNGPKNQQ